MFYRSILVYNASHVFVIAIQIPPYDAELDAKSHSDFRGGHNKQVFKRVGVAEWNADYTSRAQPCLPTIREVHTNISIL